MNESDVKLNYIIEKKKFEEASDTIGEFMSFKDYIQACGYFYVDEDES